MAKERLQKVMAEAGIASRRQCEEIILDGLVSVNRKVVDSLPCLVDIQVDKITVDGKRLKFEEKVYFLLHKPKKVVCTNSDPEGRVRAVDLLRKVKQRVYPVGRLDADTKGLIIMTNDGNFANELTHPKYGVPKTYEAVVKGAVHGDNIEKLKKGVWLDKQKATIEKVKILQRGPRTSLLEITLREGRNRQIRRMLARVGHPVQQLTRTKIGTISIKGLGPKKFRPLTEKEIVSLRKSAKPKPLKTTKKKNATKSSKKTTKKTTKKENVKQAKKTPETKRTRRTVLKMD